MSGFSLPVGLCTLLSNHQVIHISVNFRCIPQPSTTSWGLASPAWCLLGACCSRRVVVHGRLAPKAHRVTCMTRMVFSTFLYRAFTARIGEDIDGQGQTTPGQDRHETVLTEGAHQAIEGHRGDMADHRGQLQTETTMGGQQGIAGHLRMHLAVTQDEVGQDGEHCTTRGALETPEGDPAQTDPEVMRVAWQAPTSLTSRLVFELKDKGEEKGEDAFDKRFSIAQQLIIGRFAL